jgi:hypothetical protein
MRFAGSPRAFAPNHHAKERLPAALEPSIIRRENAPDSRLPKLDRSTIPTRAFLFQSAKQIPGSPNAAPEVGSA